MGIQIGEKDRMEKGLEVWPSSCVMETSLGVTEYGSSGPSVC